MAADDARAVDWFSVARPPKLAFDHEDSEGGGGAASVEVRYQPIGF